ncbi:hypothetical protein BX666DRAFT_2024579 [Dichotomocladium elegans]|nr:hypothetical protein BX666DRAFT_2024579 [Dichotomocladium elegans]
MFYLTIIKSLVVLFMFVGAIHAANARLGEQCTQKNQLAAAENMCKSHGQVNVNLGCLCDGGMAVCLQVDVNGSKITSVCEPKVFDACSASCGANLRGVKCEGKVAAKCLGADHSAAAAAAKKQVRGQHH